MDISKWGFEINAQNHLVIGGCGAVDLALQYGTPLPVIDRKKLIENFTRFASAFNSTAIKAETFYFYKTNWLPGMLKILHNLGACAAVISNHELKLAPKLGVPPEEIQITHWRTRLGAGHIDK